MSVADQTALSSKSPRRILATVRLGSCLVNELRNLQLTQITRADENRGAGGLLFGTLEQELLSVEAFTAFPVENDSSRREWLEAAFERSLAMAKTDPDLTSLQLVGWYSIRGPGDTAPLSEQDIKFHNRRFRRATDVALILRPKQGPNASVDSVEIYSRSSLDAALSWRDHRLGTCVLASKVEMNASRDIALRGSVDDDYCLKVFQVLDSLDRAEKKEGWKRIALRLKPVTPSGFRPKWMRRKISGAVDSKAPNASSSALEAKPQSAPSNASPSLAPADPPRPSARWTQTKMRWLVPALSVVLVLGVALTWFYARSLLSALPGKDLFHLTAASSRLNLQVEPQQGGSLLVKWDTHSRAVQNASQGMVQIDDGHEHHDLPFDSSQVANGSILYAPISKDLTFRLEVFQANGPPISESMRVVDGTKTALSAHSLSDATSQSPSELERIKTRNSRLEALVAVLRQRKRSPEKKVMPEAGGPSELPKTIPVSKEKPALQQINTKSQMKARTPALADSTTLPQKLGPDQSVSSSPASTQVASSPALLHAKTRSSDRTLVQPANTPPNSGEAEVPKTPSLLSFSQPKAINDISSPRYVPPRPLKQVMPHLPNSVSSGLYGPADIEVDVRIDEGGRVTDAHIVNNRADTSGLLTSAALGAAREWIFEPAKMHGKDIPSDHMIKFRFHPQAGQQ